MFAWLLEELARKVLVNDIIETTPLEIRLQVVEEMLEEVQLRAKEVRLLAEQLMQRWKDG